MFSFDLDSGIPGFSHELGSGSPQVELAWRLPETKGRCGRSGRENEDKAMKSPGDAIAKPCPLSDTAPFDCADT